MTTTTLLADEFFSALQRASRSDAVDDTDRALSGVPPSCPGIPDALEQAVDRLVPVASYAVAGAR